MMARKSAAPARLPITLPTTLVVASGGVESWVFSVPASVAAVVAAGAGAPFVFAGSFPPPPQADVEAEGSDDDVNDICVDSWVEVKDGNEVDAEDVDTNDEELLNVEDKVADNSEPENVNGQSRC